MQVQVEKPKESIPFKVGIVGCDSRAFKTKEQEVKAKDAVYKIFQDVFSKILEVPVALTEKQFLEMVEKSKPETTFIWDDFPHMFVKEKEFPYLEINMQYYWQKIKDNLTVITGGCPIGTPRLYCVTCDRYIEGENFHENPEIHKDHTVIRVSDKGGVDTLTIIVATKLGLKIKIFPPVCTQVLKPVNAETIEKATKFRPATFEECQQWYDEHPEVPKGSHFWEKHFKPRNIQIAEEIPLPPNGVLYDIEVAGSCRHCNGKGRKVTPSIHYLGSADVKKCNFCEGTGAYSGGYFTFKQARERGKEVYQIIIE